jgi:peptidoglycan/LPS O-acetylase OafA/YrhL
MEPIFGFLLFGVVVTIVAVVSAKRHQKWWAYALASIIIGFIAVPVVSAAGGSGGAAGFAAFLAPIGALFVSLSRPTGEAMAVQTGASSDFRKCPFCAEAIRREAVKCKHCGSEVSPAA